MEAVMPSNHLILCRPLLLPSIFPSTHVFSNESPLGVRWPEYWSYSLSISPCSEYSGLMFFRMDWLDLLAVQPGMLRVFSSTAVWMHIRHRLFLSLMWHAVWNRRGVWGAVYFGVFLPETVRSSCPPDGSAKVGKVMRWHSGFFQTYLPVLLHLSLRGVLPGQLVQVSREALKEFSIQAEGASRHLKIRELANTPHSICFAFLTQPNYSRCVSLTFFFSLWYFHFGTPQGFLIRSIVIMKNHN